MAKKEFSVTVYGATGFTGRLVAEYLSERKIKRWAIAGRNHAKLEALRAELGKSDGPAIIKADAERPETLQALCERSQVVLTTVGPYQLYGTPLVEACAQNGTDYVDLCGESNWIRAMIDRFEATARQSGARLIFSAGFDSIPSDLGVWFLQKEAIRRFGSPAPRVKGRVRALKGGASGGTLASMKEVLRAGMRNPEVLRLLNDPFALTPGFSGPAQPTGLVPEYDQVEGKWAIPFVMAPINTKTVHRTNYLLGFPYGRDFTYDEMQYTTLADTAKAIAGLATRLNPFGGRMPRPGEGPSKEERESGFFEVVFFGEYPDGRRLTASIYGQRDPGYGATSRMVAETALALAEKKSPGGIYTPAALLAEELLLRLPQNAGITFRMEDG
ncbi:MAG: saccharopine dehydrogenase NADP-binding domain-containing protein [Turneriella sp.]|nr:saccharopine dehydrogenase NADP-binding domain-containing protein [Turneriella sp.]